MPSLLESLQGGPVLLMDGAMGTELQRAGLRAEECGELWNLTRADRVRAIHRAYHEAGACCLLSNTFLSNPVRLASLGHADDLERINGAAIKLAREAGGPDAFVLADVGPVDLGAADLRRLLRSLRTADALLVETCSDTRLLDAISLCRWHDDTEAPPLLFSFTFLRDTAGQVRTNPGLTPEATAEQAARFPIVALGVNCGRDMGMEEVLEVVRRYRRATDLPLFARPNAGTPQSVDGRWVYPLTPQHMAEQLPPLLEAGVRLIGGCCGTTPEHIAACRPVVDAWNARQTKPGDAG